MKGIAQLKKSSLDDFSKKRYQICQQCSEYQLGICKKCSCIMVLKTKLKNASCPLGKWNSYNYEDWL